MSGEGARAEEGRTWLDRLADASWQAMESKGSESPYLHRRHQLRLALEADTLHGLISALQFLTERLDREQRENAEITSGGPDNGWHLTLATDPDMTPERYREYLRSKPWRNDRPRPARDDDYGQAVGEQ